MGLVVARARLSGSGLTRNPPSARLLLLRAMWEASGEALRAGRVRVRPQDGGAPLQEALGSLQMPLLGGLWLPGLGDVCSLPEASCSESG